jgi:hypothetical protein
MGESVSSIPTPRLRELQSSFATAIDTFISHRCFITARKYVSFKQELDYEIVRRESRTFQHSHVISHPLLRKFDGETSIRADQIRNRYQLLIAHLEQIWRRDIEPIYSKAEDYERDLSVARDRILFRQKAELDSFMIERRQARSRIVRSLSRPMPIIKCPIRPLAKVTIPFLIA